MSDGRPRLFCCHNYFPSNPLDSTSLRNFSDSSRAIHLNYATSVLVVCLETLYAPKINKLTKLAKFICLFLATNINSIVIHRLLNSFSYCCAQQNIINFEWSAHKIHQVCLTYLQTFTHVVSFIRVAWLDGFYNANLLPKSIMVS
jgi:hypothetical protein